jgi:hypothetical protein
VESNPYGEATELMATSIIRKLSAAGFWISAAALPICFIMIFINPLVLMQNRLFFEQLSSGALYGTSFAAALMGCIFFRKRFFDPIFGTISVAICFANVGFLVESAYFSYLVATEQDSGFTDMSLFLATAMLLFVPAIIGSWLVAKLRAELVSDIANGVYSRFLTALDR